MARVKADVFGCDEMEKAFKRAMKRTDDEMVAMLNARGGQAKKRVYAKTPKGKKKKEGDHKHLKSSWRKRGPKDYRNGKVKVVAVASDAPHSHLYENGYDLFKGGKTRRNGRSKRMSDFELRLRGVRKVGHVPGHHILRDTMNEEKKSFKKNAASVFEKALKDIEVE